MIHMAQSHGPAGADDGGRRRGQRGAEGRPGAQGPRPLPATTAAGKTVAIWGLAFKPRTDDIREAPALVLIDALLAAGVALRVHDPEALANVRAIYGDRLTYCDRPYGALEQADALAIVTEWNEFRNPDFEVMARLLRQPVDLRRPQPLRPRADGRPRLHLPRHRPRRRARAADGERGLTPPAAWRASRDGCVASSMTHPLPGRVWDVVGDVAPGAWCVFRTRHTLPGSPADLDCAASPHDL